MKNNREKVVLADIAALYDSLHKTPKYSDDGYPMVRITDIKRGYLDLSSTKKVDENIYKEFTNKYKPQIGDILFSRVGASYGTSSYVNNYEAFCLGQNTVCISPNHYLIDSFYLFCCLNSFSVKQQIDAVVGGAAQPTISLKNINLLEIPYPNFPTQKKIAGILKAYDDLIENNTRRIEILEEMTRSLYREWFVNFRFPGHEQVKMVDSELGLIPEGWEVKKFGEVSLNFDSKRKPLSSIQRAEMKGEYPYYGASGIIDYVEDYIFDGKYLLISEDGENLNSRKKPIAFLAYKKFWVNNHAHIVQGKSPISTEFLYLLISGLNIAGYITGAAQPKFNQANLNRIPVVIPINNLLNLFNQIVENLLTQIEILGRKNANLRQSRDLLLPKLISGEIDVENLDINTGEIAA
jgi:type I restriction enzyme S subunit